ncbi:hypothetical protein KR018_004133 [Drosophila ironensis]|nr:hypothetical protein KR018_004133 [Drosophila ironensis]
MVKLNCGWLVLVLVAISKAQEDSEDSTTVATTSNGALTEETCGKKRSGCCDELYMGEDEVIQKCMILHAPKLPDPDEKDTGKLLRFLSCFVECLYKHNKYIGKSDTVNMKMVKLHAETAFADRPKEKEYYIGMYDFCRKDGSNVYNLIKATPGAKVLLKGTCRPYLLMVFLCIADYHKTHGCPYFRWEGNYKKGTEDQCEDARAKCYAIDGIVLPERKF